MIQSNSDSETSYYFAKLPAPCWRDLGGQFVGKSLMAEFHGIKLHEAT